MRGEHNCRSCVVAVIVGATVGLILRTVLALAGVPPPWFIELALASAAAVLCLGCKLLYERVVYRDYDKLVEGRRQRMHW